jgi:uncharacterized membrane protein
MELSDEHSLERKSSSPTATEIDQQEEKTQIVSKTAELLSPFLKNPQQAMQAAAQVVVAVSESYSGPIPHPRHLEEIERIAPGSARLIIDAAMREQKHRHSMQQLEILYPYGGLICGFILMALCIAGAVFMGMENKPIIVGLLLGVPTLTGIGWFVKSRVQQPEQKSPAPHKSVTTRTAKKRR